MIFRIACLFAVVHAGDDAKVMLQKGKLGDVAEKMAIGIARSVDRYVPSPKPHSLSNMHAEMGADMREMDISTPIGEVFGANIHDMTSDDPFATNNQIAREGQEDAADTLATSQLGTDLNGRPFDVDAPLSGLKWEPKSISVILPCAEEREFALKTVESVFNNTPPEMLLEIVVVDDGSDPPLSHTHLTEEVQKKYKVKIVRHDKTVGLIEAKKDGGDAAQGDILVFFDCHVAPQPGWHKDFLKLIGQNWRRLVIPQITDLDIDTWTQRSGGGAAKCYLTWDMDFKWFDSDDPDVPAISGGLLGLSKRWWRESGGYDLQMMGWGGENIDQSLRMWLCGGEIMASSEAQVAHMWRVGNDARTSAHYKHVGDTEVNRARAAYAWYGNFTTKLLDYPNFKARMETSEATHPWYGDLSNLLAVKDRLKCRPFAWFLRRFKKVYEDSGMIPEKIFMLKHEQSGKCLAYGGPAGSSPDGEGSTSLQACNKGDDRQFWHLSNKDQNNNGQCCSGMKAWNTDQCMIGQGSKTGVCDISGANSNQHWALSSQELSRIHEKVPIETQLYRKEQAENPALFKRLEKQLTEI